MRPALLRFLIGQIQYHPYGILMDGRLMDYPLGWAISIEKQQCSRLRAAR